MNLEKSGGPMMPTISGKRIDDTTFQFEGMTLFDYFVGQFIMSGSESAVESAVAVMEKRNKHLIGGQNA
jgi:hypothetical protein